jgi:DNA repair exonuclease SbcCD nuclease subunit
MKRTKQTQIPDAIITGDIELRAHTPLCRLDDHWAAQERKIKFISDLANKYNCPILDGGDLFDKKYKQSPNYFLVSWAIRNLPRPIFTVPGNHDLPGKSMANYDRSAMKVLESAGVISKKRFFALRNERKVQIYRIPWGEPVEPVVIEINDFDYNVLLIHTMVYDDNMPFPGCEGWEKGQLLRMFSNFDLIVSGHHHATFTGFNKRTNTLLVNPGSLMRNDADQENFKPSIFLWFAAENRVEQVFVPIESGVVSRFHLEEVKEKEERLSAFVEKLGEQVVTGINFEQNLQALLTKDIDRRIIDKVWQYYEGV